MRVRLGCLFAGVVAALPVAAPAQDDAEPYGAAGYDAAPSTNVYVEGRAALVFLRDQDVSGAVNGEVESDTGFGGSLTVGYHLLESVRVELEGTLDVNDVDTARPVTVPVRPRQNPAGSGDTLTIGAFGNAYYDVDTGTAFTPYVGAGFGVLRIDAEYDAFALEDKDTLPAYQAMVGLTWNVTRKTGLTLGYRFRSTIDDPEFDAPAGSVETESTTHGVQLGLRYRF